MAALQKAWRIAENWQRMLDRTRGTERAFIS